MHFLPKYNITGDNKMKEQIKIDNPKPPHKITFDRDAYPVTRVEVVDNNGRAYTKHNVEIVEISFQDDYKTLKLIVTLEDEKENAQ